jgi:hypothetical protein
MIIKYGTALPLHLTRYVHHTDTNTLGTSRGVCSRVCTLRVAESPGQLDLLVQAVWSNAFFSSSLGCIHGSALCHNLGLGRGYQNLELRQHVEACGQCGASPAAEIISV